MGEKIYKNTIPKACEICMAQNDTKVPNCSNCNSNDKTIIILLEKILWRLH
jgi:hypothetical protein